MGFSLFSADARQNFDFICCNVVTKGPEDCVCEAEVVREKDILFKLQFTCQQCFRVSESAERGLSECVPWGDTAVCYSTRLESLSGSWGCFLVFVCGNIVNPLPTTRFRAIRSSLKPHDSV